jgi:hypothetical protein
LGLWSRRLDDSNPNAPDRRRRLWDVFRLADADGWKEAFAFAKPIAGITDWKEAMPYAGPIPKVSGRFAPSIDPASIVFSLIDDMTVAHVTNCLAWRPNWAEGSDGLLCPAILQHPMAPDKGPGEAVYRVDLPRPKPGARLVFRFGTTITGPTDDGVRMSVAVNGKELWSRTLVQKKQPHQGMVDLSAYAGRSIHLTLRVDARGNNAGDWSNWLRPVIVAEVKGEGRHQ